jgi:hypothetical protein
MNNSSVISTNTSKAELTTILREQPAVVTFTKKDGTTRRMLCSLQEGVVVPHEKKTERTVEPKDDILPVWDIEASAWRSINIDTVHSIETIEVL